MSEINKTPSRFEVKIYIDKNGDVTITSLFKELIPLLKKLSPAPEGEEK